MQLKQSSRALLIMVTLTALILAFGAGTIVGAGARPAVAAETPGEFRVFWEAWDLVVDNFVDRDKVNFTDMTYGAIRGMLATLDDQNHTSFFTPEEARQEQSQLEGSYHGIGAYVGMEEGVFKILTPFRGSPAEVAGVLPGDVVLMVDGKEIAGLSESEIISRIRGPAGTQVVLTVLHEESDTPVEITVARGEIEVDSVLWSRIPDTNLVYLQITQFADDTSSELIRALEEIDAAAVDGAPVEGILLDLRNNPGGYLHEALRVASQFLTPGQIILHERDAEGALKTYESEGRGLARSVPIIALINGGTASAGEILAGALQENGRARLVGETTLGTGTVLRPYTLSDGSVLRLGVTNWLTPKEHLIKGEGVKPDVEIQQEVAVPLIDSLALEEMDAKTLLEQEDKQFKSALILLRLEATRRAQAVR